MEEVTLSKSFRKHTDGEFHHIVNGKSKHKEKSTRTTETARSSPNHMEDESNDTPPDVPERSPVRIPNHPPPPSRKTSAADKVFFNLTLRLQSFLFYIYFYGFVAKKV